MNTTTRILVELNQVEHFVGDSIDHSFEVRMQCGNVQLAQRSRAYFCKYSVPARGKRAAMWTINRARLRLFDIVSLRRYDSTPQLLGKRPYDADVRVANAVTRWEVVPFAWVAPATAECWDLTHLIAQFGDCDSDEKTEAFEETMHVFFCVERVAAVALGAIVREHLKAATREESALAYAEDALVARLEDAGLCRNDIINWLYPTTIVCNTRPDI